MFSLSDLAKKAKELRTAIKHEEAKRAEVKYSPEYQSIELQIAKLDEKRQAMLASVPDSTTAYDAATAELAEAFKAENVVEFEDIKATFKETNKVNVSRLLNVLEGDVDNLLAIANVTQIALKDLAKTFPEKKQPIMDCVEVIDRKIVGFTFAA